MSTGCHACARQGCHSTSATCYAKCTPWPKVFHVCPSVRSGSGGCENCGHLCHKSNADPLCTFYSRNAGQLEWAANAQELLDAQSGSGGKVPHMHQVTWQWQAVGVVIVDRKIYDVGYGNPGGCNDCLIDSLRQCLALDTNPRKVRADLVKAFAHAQEERAKVTDESYLNLDSHWQEILRALFRHNTCGAGAECDIHMYCVIALYKTSVDNGLVVGDINAPRRLVVMNTADVHFDPCLPR